jgi:hypothetical protein
MLTGKPTKGVPEVVDCAVGIVIGDRELEGMCKDTGFKIYTGSGCQGGEPYVLLGDQVWRPALGIG